MPKSSAQQGSLPAPALLIRELTPPLSPKQEGVATLWFHSCPNFSAPHGRLSAPALLKRELTPPQKPKPPKTGSDLCE